MLAILKLILPHKWYRRIVYHSVRFWGRRTVLSTGSTVEVIGRENLPSEGSICYISNHQGMFDIPLVLGFMDHPVGFIAKQELFKIPVLSWWMQEIPCVFIDRGSARKAMESFTTSAKVIKEGHPMVIFPEGTRSRSDDVAAFHLGSFKLPVMAEATIVPLAIKGSWRIHEIDKGIHKTHLKLKIMPPILPTDPLYKDKHALSDTLHQMISDAVYEM